MITRLRNASLSKLRRVYVFQTVSSLSIAQILKENNYIDSFFPDLIFAKNLYICLNLKTGLKDLNSISFLKRISRPGLRIYKNAKNLSKVLGGMGVSVFRVYLVLLLLFLENLLLNFLEFKNLFWHGLSIFI